MKKRDLGFGCLGNGVTVYDRLHEKNGDYETVAHISAYREIKYYTQLSENDKALVEKVSQSEDSVFYNSSISDISSLEELKKINE